MLRAALVLFITFAASEAAAQTACMGQSNPDGTCFAAPGAPQYATPDGPSYQSPSAPSEAPGAPDQPTTPAEPLAQLPCPPPDPNALHSSMDAATTMAGADGCHH